MKIQSHQYSFHIYYIKIRLNNFGFANEYRFASTFMANVVIIHQIPYLIMSKSRLYVCSTQMNDCRCLLNSHRPQVTISNGLSISKFRAILMVSNFSFISYKLTGASLSFKSLIINLQAQAYYKSVYYKFQLQFLLLSQ